jgi:hypothetical protein
MSDENNNKNMEQVKTNMEQVETNMEQVVENKEIIQPTAVEIVHITDEKNSTIVDTLINSIEGMIHGEINALNIFSITVNLMQLVEKYPKMRGPEKKALVILVIQKLIKKYASDEALLSLIPAFIDQAISIDKGKVTINVDEAASSCLSACFSCK